MYQPQGRFHTVKYEVLTIDSDGFCFLLYSFSFAKKFNAKEKNALWFTP